MRVGPGPTAATAPKPNHEKRIGSMDIGGRRVLVDWLLTLMVVSHEEDKKVVLLMVFQSTLEASSVCSCQTATGKSSLVLISHSLRLPSADDDTS